MSFLSNFDSSNNSVNCSVLFVCVFVCFFFQIGNLEKNVQNLKVQLAGANGNHKEAMDQVINLSSFSLPKRSI